MSMQKSNAKAHPGFPDRPQVRRTTKQVQEDKSCAMKAAAAQREKEEVNHWAVLASIARIEDSIQQEEEEVHLHSKRPDLHYNPQQKGKCYDHGSEDLFFLTNCCGSLTYRGLPHLPSLANATQTPSKVYRLRFYRARFRTIVSYG